MKVLQINSVCGTGSTGKLAVQISDCLNSHGIENYIAYGFGSCDRPNTFKFGNMADAHLHSFLSRKLCVQGYGSWFTTGKLIRYIKTIRPDVVHLHNIHGHYLNFPQLFRFLKKYNCHVVWTFHDCWPMTGKCTHFTEAGCNKWQTQCENCPQLSAYPDSTRDRSRKNHLDKKKYFSSLEKLHVVTVSQWLKETAEASFFQGSDIRCIYNGIDLTLFQPTPSSIRDSLGIGNKFMILGVSNQWNNKKGYDKFLALSQQLSENAVIVLVGGTPAQKDSLPANVIGVTRTENPQQLAQLYTAADVLVNLSLEETFGLVVAEALACGTPAIVLNSTACPEVVDAQTGIVIDPDGTQLPQALAEIQENGPQHYKSACVQRVQKLFSNETMQQRYYLLYRGLEKSL